MASNLLDLPRLDASLVTDPLHEAYDALVDCIERRIWGYHSSRNLYYETLYGLLLMSGQSFGAIGLLVNDSAGDRSFPVQAAILARAMLEGLGNVLVLRESPEERARLYGLDVTRNLWDEQKVYASTFTDPRWAVWVQKRAEQLQWWKDRLQVTPEEWAALPRWPGVRRLNEWMTGSAAEVWSLLYIDWYGPLSMATHQTGTSLIMAIQRHHCRGEERQALRQDAIGVAIIAHAAVLAEVCASAPALSLPVEPLRAAWERLRLWGNSAERPYKLRYRDLLDGK